MRRLVLAQAIQLGMSGIAAGETGEDHDHTDQGPEESHIDPTCTHGLRRDVGITQARGDELELTPSLDDHCPRRPSVDRPERR